MITQTDSTAPDNQAGNEIDSGDENQHQSSDCGSSDDNLSICFSKVDILSWNRLSPAGITKGAPLILAFMEAQYKQKGASIEVPLDSLTAA